MANKITIYDYLKAEVKKANSHTSVNFRFRVMGKIEMAEMLKAISSEQCIELIKLLQLA